MLKSKLGISQLHHALTSMFSAMTCNSNYESYARRVLGGLALILFVTFPTAAKAEVMDKEPTLLVVLVWGLIGSVGGFLACRKKPAYGLATFALPALVFWFHFAELNDPHVGPAISREAGRLYFVGSGIAAALLVIGHVGGLWAWGRRSRVAKRDRYKDGQTRRGR